MKLQAKNVGAELEGAKLRLEGKSFRSVHATSIRNYVLSVFTRFQNNDKETFLLKNNLVFSPKLP